MVVRSGMSLTLFVAGRGPNSVTALGNLRSWCRDHDLDESSIEVVDVVAAPSRALQEGVLLTPQLVIRDPNGAQRFVGTLHDGDVARALRAAVETAP